MFPRILDQIAEIMTKNPVTIDSGKLFIDAARLMDEKNIGGLIVVENGKCVGLVTERDFLCLAAAGIDTRTTPVKQHMTKPVVTCSPSAKIVEAYVLMRKNRVRHLPVLEKDGKPVGMVTMRDLLAIGELRL
jgi:CBS domain-containing protein